MSQKNQLRLRPYRLEDGDKIVTWCADEAAFFKWSAGILGDYPLSPGRFHQVIAARDNGYYPFVAEAEGEPVGFFILRQPGDDPEVLRFGFVILNPAFRGKGYGKAILQKLAAIALERGCGRMEWWCLDWNKPSIDFYRSLGAEPMSDWTVYRLTGETLKNLAEMPE